MVIIDNIKFKHMLLPFNPRNEYTSLIPDISWSGCSEIKGTCVMGSVSDKYNLLHGIADKYKCMVLIPWAYGNPLYNVDLTDFHIYKRETSPYGFKIIRPETPLCFQKLYIKGLIKQYPATFTQYYGLPFFGTEEEIRKAFIEMCLLHGE